MEKYNFYFEEEPCRLDAFLSHNMDLTRSSIQKLIEDGMTEVNGKKVGKSYKLKKFDNVTVCIPDPEPLSVEAENIPLDIMYEDDYLLVVNKPKGMVVHPAPGNYSGTLVNALIYHCKDSLSGINGVMRPGIVHRIDKDTSGLLIVAKNDLAHGNLALQIKEHSFTREYEAVVVGNVKTDEGDIELPIGRHPVNRKQMAVTYKNSKPAKTHYQVLERSEGLSHLRLTLFTGRTHQIRVHMSYLGHPLAGDVVYGRAGAKYKQLCGQCLHAKKIGFIHPKTNEYMEFESELPKYFKDFLKESGFNRTF
ncbi:MAG: RluA family pseudouridine synthase [Acutalibacteraceae bacterium]|nr:RluA family pseudouridine synthase [Acutalibacteraceae bacterium]